MKTLPSVSTMSATIVPSRARRGGERIRPQLPPSGCIGWECHRPQSEAHSKSIHQHHLREPSIWLSWLESRRWCRSWLRRRTIIASPRANLAHSGVSLRVSRPCSCNPRLLHERFARAPSAPCPPPCHPEHMSTGTLSQCRPGAIESPDLRMMMGARKGTLSRTASDNRSDNWLRRQRKS